MNRAQIHHKFAINSQVDALALPTRFRLLATDALPVFGALKQRVDVASARVTKTALYHVNVTSQPVNVRAVIT